MSFGGNLTWRSSRFAKETILRSWRRGGLVYSTSSVTQSVKEPRSKGVKAVEQVWQRFSAAYSTATNGRTFLRVALTFGPSSARSFSDSSREHNGEPTFECSTTTGSAISYCT